MIPSSSIEGFGLTAKVYGWTVWRFETFRRLVSWQKPFNPVPLWCFDWQSHHRPRPSPLLNGFTFQFILFNYIIFIFLSFHQAHHNLMLSRSAVTLPSSRYWNMPKSTSTVPVDSVLHFFILLRFLPNLSWPSQSLHPMFLLWHVFHGSVHYLERMQSNTYLQRPFYNCISEETVS